MASQLKEMNAVAEQLKTVMKVSEEDSGMTGLDKCREMDKQLAEMASAKFSDIPDFVLEEIFQFIDLFKLLVFRRCSNKWHETISRESAPHLRSVVLALDAKTERTLVSIADPEKYRASRKLFVGFWQFAKQPTTVMVFETPKKTEPRCVEADEAVHGIWMCYDCGTAAGRTRFIEKVIYANTNVNAREFRATSVCRVGVRTVLHNCEIDLKTYQILPYEIDGLDSDDEDDTEDSDWVDCFTFSTYDVNVAGTDSFVLEDHDLNKNFPSSAIVQLIKRNAKAPTLEDFTEEMQYLDYTKHLPDLLYRFVGKFDPSNTKALDCYLKGDTSGFLVAAHPMVSSLMHFTHKVAKFFRSAEYHAAGRYSDSDYDDWYDSDDWC